MEKPQFLIVGRIIAPRGVKGEVKVEVMTDFPERFSPSEEIYIEGCPVSIEGVRWHNGKMTIKLEHVDTIENAEKMRGRFLEIPLSRAHPLPQGDYYQFQVVGLEVWTSHGEFLGKIEGILPTGSNDVYVVHGHHGELLIPAIEDVVKMIDPDRGRVVVELIDGIVC